MKGSCPIKYIFVLALCPMLLLSCSSARKMAKAKKQLVDTLASLPVSEIDIPVKICAAPLLAKAEQVVPKEFTSDSWPNYIQPSCDFRYKYRFLRSLMHVSCTDNEVHVRFTGSYQVAGSRCICTAGKPVTPWISGSCGFGKEPLRKVNIGIRSQLSFLPAYEVRTNTSADQLRAIDKCYVSLFSSDITQLILDSIQSSVSSFCSTLDQTIAGLSFNGIVHKASAMMYQKTVLGKYGFLLVDPTNVRIGPLNYTADSFRISVGLSCRPELSSDSVNHINILSTLPPLEQKENRPGISLYLNADYDYAFLSRLLADTLRNKVFEIKGRSIIVKEVQMKGLGNRQVEIKIDFAGSNRGSIYLRGTPVLDSAKQALSVPDITYSLEGADLALKIARSLFRNKIRKTIKGKSYLDIGALVRSNLPALDARLNTEITKGIFSSGKVSDVRVIGLLAGSNSLQVQLFIGADVSVLSNGVF